MVRVEDPDRPAERPAAVTVLRRERVIERAFPARIAERSAEIFRLGEMRSPARVPLELAGRCARRPEDNVGDLPRKAGDAEARRVDDLDALDAAGGNALQLIDGAARFVGNALAVDQHVLRRLAEPALHLCGADGEARHLDDHVIGGPRCEAGEVGGRVDPLCGRRWGRLRWRPSGIGRRGLRERLGRENRATAQQNGTRGTRHERHRIPSVQAARSARATFVACYICSGKASLFSTNRRTAAKPLDVRHFRERACQPSTPC